MIIDGKKIGEEIQAELARKIRGHKPVLGVILVGANPASQIYVQAKRKACAAVGIESKFLALPSSIAESNLVEHIEQWNRDSSVHGILIQFPLPPHISETVIVRAIDPMKDVDGFHPINVGRLSTGQSALVPCTPLGAMRLLRETEVTLKGARAIVIGRSNIVGKPMAQLLLAQDATVTIAHSRTSNLAELCRTMDVVVAAVGRAEMVKADWIKSGAAVIDVGINRIELPEGKSRLVGDVAYAECKEIAGAITPVPGGVGPMTIAMLLQNTLTAARARN